MVNKDFKDILLNLVNIEYKDVEYNDIFKFNIVRTRDNKAFLLDETKQVITNSLCDSIEIKSPEIIATKEGKRILLKFENGNLIV